MFVKRMRPRYLVLLGFVGATLLFYSVYISKTPVVVRLPTPQTHQQTNNETLILTIGDIGNNENSSIISVQDHTDTTTVDVTNKIIVKNNSITPKAVNAPIAAVQLNSNSNNNNNNNNAILGAQKATTMGMLAEGIYESGYLKVNPNICPDLGNSLQLLIIVTSAPSHMEARMAVRQTWGHYKIRRDVAIAFILGTTPNTTLNTALDNEDYMYGDLIRGKFVDTYDNLTLKTISTLDWVDNYCPNVAFVLKTDDDMFINVSKLLMLISKYNRYDRIIYGRLAVKWKPVRNKKSKYYVSPHQYKPNVFPDFTTGPAYLMPTCVVHDLYVAALNHTYFKLEDVYVTGIVAHYIGVNRIHVNEFLNKRIAFSPCNVQKSISIHMVTHSEQFDLWKKLLDGRSKCM